MRNSATGRVDLLRERRGEQRKAIKWLQHMQKTPSITPLHSHGHELLSPNTRQLQAAVSQMQALIFSLESRILSINDSARGRAMAPVADNRFHSAVSGVGDLSTMKRFQAPS